MAEDTIIYPRGFLGFKTPGTVITDNQLSIKDVINSAKLNNMFPTKKSYISNKLVDDLYTSYSESSNMLNSFHFREQILLVAFSAFGGSFYKWCKLQKENQSLSGLQKKFLNDTFNYLNGNPRSVSVSTWVGLLETKHVPSKDSTIEYNMDAYFNNTGSLVGLSNVSLYENLIKWSMQNNGFEDLIVTLYILFGKV